MPLDALKTIDGHEIPLASIDPVRDWKRLGASPATIQLLLSRSRKRDHLAGGFTASMIGKEPRQIMLEETCSYSMAVPQMIAAELAVTDHDAINVSGTNILANVRVYSNRFPWLSGELDNAAIVEVIEEANQVTFVLELFDLKRGGWYGAQLFARNPFSEKAHSDYAWQLNCLATLLEEQPEREVIVILQETGTWPDMDSSDPRLSKPWRFQVRSLWIESAPRDASYKHEPEAAKLGIVDPHLFLVEVPRKSAEEVYAKYEAEYLQLVAAREEGWAEICSNRWANNIRCSRYCSVKEHCMQLADARGEAHPLGSLEQLLAASLKR